MNTMSKNPNGKTRRTPALEIGTCRFNRAPTTEGHCAVHCQGGMTAGEVA